MHQLDRRHNLRIFYLLLFSGLFVTPSQAQIITTYAGANRAFLGDGQPATSLFLSKISTVALDSSGNPVFAVPFRNVVLRVNPDGTLTRLAGTGTPGFSGDGTKATNASLKSPHGAAFDSAGNLYIADTGNNRIRVVSQDGIIATFAGTDQGSNAEHIPAKQATLTTPTSVLVDSQNNVYIDDEGSRRIRRVTPDQLIATYLGNGTNTPFQNNQPAISTSLLDPAGMALDSSGALYVADFLANRVLKVDPQTFLAMNIAGTGVAGDASENSQANTSPLRNPGGVAVDAAHNVYVSDTGNFKVRKIASSGIIATFAGNGQTGFSGDSGLASAASLNAAFGLAIDSKSNVFIADRDNFRLRRVDASLRISTVAGNGTSFDNGVSATGLLLFQPTGVNVASDGSLMISDSGSDVVRRVRSDGLSFTVAGNGGHGYGGDGGLATSAEFSTPSNVAFDSVGNLYIADTDNHVIREVDTTGVVTTVAGNGTPGYNGDTIPATQASLNRPTSIAIDTAGIMYIADSGNHKIRRVSGGVITTIAGTGQPSFFGENVAASTAALNNPSSLAFDANGNLLIADTLNNCVRRISLPAMIITTVAGRGQVSGTAADGGNARTASLGLVLGVAGDAAGNVYFTDITTNLVRKVSATNVISTIAGNGKPGFSGDGGSATQASLNLPFQVAVDNAGDVFIADYGNDRVRVVSASPPSFQTDSNLLNFTAASSGLPTDSQAVNLTTPLAGLPYSVSITPAASWLSVAPPSGQMPAKIGIIADPSQLQSALYETDILFTSPLAVPPTRTTHIRFTVGEVRPSKLAPESSQIAFAFAKTGSASNRSLRILNGGGGTLAFDILPVTNNGGGWLRVSSTSGTATPLQPFSFAVTADPTGLDPGTYTGALIFTNRSGADTANVAVTITVSSTPQSVILSQNGLTFTAVQGGGVVPPQTFDVVNGGQGTLNWTVSASVMGPVSNWLSVTPTSGSSGTGTPPPVSVQVKPAGLAPGVYYGRILVASPTALNSPQMLAVVLNLLTRDQNPGPVVQPSGLIFSGVASGQNPQPQTILVSDLTAAPLTMGSSRTFVGTGNWFVHTPINATITPDAPVSITVTPQIAGLLPGVYQGALSLAFSDGSLRTVAIRLILAPSGSGSTADGQTAAAAAGCTPKSLVPLFTTLTGGFGVPAAWPQAIVVRVADDCGNAMTNGSVLVSFSNGDSTLRLTASNDGRWSGTWSPVHSTSSAVLTANAETTSPVLSGTTSIGGGIQDNPDPPVFTVEGMINAANSSPGAPLAPGSLISIYGLKLADSTAAAPQLPLEGDLQGVEVVMAGRKLPLQYTSSGQINAIIPYDIPANAIHSAVVLRGNRSSSVVQVPLADTLPAVFTTDNNPKGQGAILNNTSGRVFDASNPAHAGDFAVIYCTGLGTVNSTVPAGSASPGSPPAITVNPVSVTIGGVTAQVLFNGLSPGFAGLYQVNVQVPDGIPPGDAVPVVLTSAGRSGGTVTMAIR
jgi:uncharacterized protein (TIGR03437 family)